MYKLIVQFQVFHFALIKVYLVNKNTQVKSFLSKVYLRVFLNAIQVAQVTVMHDKSMQCDSTQILHKVILPSKTEAKYLP